VVFVGDVGKKDLAWDAFRRRRRAPVWIAQIASPTGLFLDVSWERVEDPHGPQRAAVIDAQLGDYVLVEGLELL
jgi:hypothetical protein